MKRLTAFFLVLAISAAALFAAELYLRPNFVATYDTSVFSSPLPKRENAAYMKRTGLGLYFDADFFLHDDSRAGLSISFLYSEPVKIDNVIVGTPDDSTYYWVYTQDPDLYFAVLTGCLRVAKESIFTGLNNFKIFSSTTVRFDEYFGFTDNEVRELLSYYGFEDKYEAVREWYDGYRFGNVEVYCPWDVISYCDDLMDTAEAEPQNYWVNTSGNESVRYLIGKMGDGVLKSEVENLVAGETVEKEIHEDLTYNEMYSSINNVWSLLFMTGYLTQRGSGDGNRRKLVIPNLEIRSIFTSQILAMFRDEAARDGRLLEEFCSALENGNAGESQRLFTAYLVKTISIRDTFVRKPAKENFYHGMLLGILGYKEGWNLSSNKESGNGFSDISIRIDDRKMGIVIEVKYAQNGQLEEVCREAIAQIDRNGYGDELKREGCCRILKYGVACCRKECRILMKEENAGEK